MFNSSALVMFDTNGVRWVGTPYSGGLSWVAQVGLLQPFHGQADSPDIGGGSSGTGARCQAHPANR